MQAFATARKGDWAQAIELAFGAPYQQTMLAIIEPLAKLEKKLHQEGQARIEVLQQQLARAGGYRVVPRGHAAPGADVIRKPRCSGTGP